MSTSPTAADAGTTTIGDLTVNRLGYGAMRITGEGIWGPPDDRDRAREVLRAAVDAGITFIDTADSYGPDVSEELIGETLAPYADDLVIATKGGLVRPGPNQWEPNGRPEHLRQACEGSLRRLELEQIPLYQFHRPDPDVPYEDSIGALVELQQEGKIRHIGISNVDVDHLRRAQRLAEVVSVQNRFNVGDRSSDELVDVCERDGIAFLPWGPLSDAESNEAVGEVARAHGVDAGQVALAWLLARSSTILPIPGTGSPDHLRQNVAAAGLELTDDEVTSINR